MNRGMKDSGIKWIGLIPNDWRIGRVKEAFCRQKNKAKQENPIILTLARSGVKVRDISNNEGQLAESYYDYNPVKIGDFLMNTMDLYSGANCSVSKVEGVISPAYANLRAKDNYDPYYYDYYFKTQYWGMVLFAHGKGVSFDHRWTLNNETLMNYYIPIPSEQEQQQIADYLDKKVSEIDSIITQTTLSIEEYKKYKQSLITEVVTKGLNSDVEMKDSGIEWIGKIPKDWNIQKLKNIVQKEEKSNMQASEHNEDGLYPFYTSSQDVIKRTNTCIYENIKAIILGTGGEASVHYCDKDFSSSADCLILTDKSNYKLNIEYVFYFLSQMKNIINDLGFDGMGLRHLQKDFLFNLFVPTPLALEQQQKIVDYLDKKVSEIDNNISQKQRLITELETYKKSLIYECVTGKREVD